MTNFKLRAIATTALVASFATPGLVLAQTGVDKEDEIIITAQKREKTLQDTPVAVTAVTDTNIKRSQIRDIRDMPLLAPSLTVAQFANSSATTFAIRGIGTSGFNAGLEPSVGVFVDGVYRSRQGASINDFPTVERIEVLRGPQSTIYGKNTPAGVVSIITKKPQYEFGMDAEATYGNHDAIVVKGSVTGPIGESEKAAFRLSGNLNQRDGFIDNLFNGEQVNERDRWALRGQFLFEPNDNVSVRVIGDFSSVNEACCAAPFIFNLPQNAFALGLLNANILPALPFERNVSFDGGLLTDQETAGLSTEIEVDMGGAVFTSTTAYRTFDEINNIDADFVDIVLARDRTLTDIYQTFTQEFRITSTGDRKVDYMFGAYYYNQDLKHTNSTTFGPGLRQFADLVGGGAVTTLEQLIQLGQAIGIPDALALGPTPSGSLLGDGVGLQKSNFAQDTETFSAFGSLDFHVNDQFIVTTGLRFSHEKKDVDAVLDINAPFSALDLNNLTFLEQFPPAGTPLGPFFSPGPIPRNAFLGLAAFQFFTPTADFIDTRSEDNLSGNIIFAYDWNDELNTYASYSRGYKAGGFNLSNSSRAGSRDFAAEKTNALEVGLKTKLFDNTSTLNLAAFYTEQNNFQQNIFNGASFDIGNADAITYGLEADFLSRPTDNFIFTLAATWIPDAHFTRFDGGPCQISEQTIGSPNAVSSCVINGSQDFKGKSVSALSDLNVSSTATFLFDAGEYDGYLRGELRYSSKNPLSADLDPIKTQSAYTVFNASLGIGDDDKGWQVQFWGRNLFDQNYLQGAFNSVGQPGSFNGYPGDPRTYGITLRLQR